MSDLKTSENFFEAMYLDNSDPWSFATSEYENSRYSAIVDALFGCRFARAFEPGCSIGVLTEKLAGFCGLVEAIEISKTAVSRARTRCRNFANVHIAHGALPLDIPEGEFDLVVFSEIGYYFSSTCLLDLVTRLVGKLTPGGVMTAAHWLGSSPDHLLSGDEVHECLNTAAGLTMTMSRRYEKFRLDQWTKA